MNKQFFHSENRIYPQFTMADLRSDIIEFAIKRASFKNRNHPWQDMSDMELIKSAKLYGRDLTTQQEGFTLAGILLFGTDDAILDVIPFHLEEMATVLEKSISTVTRNIRVLKKSGILKRVGSDKNGKWLIQ